MSNQKQIEYLQSSIDKLEASIEQETDLAKLLYFENMLFEITGYLKLLHEEMK